MINFEKKLLSMIEEKLWMLIVFVAFLIGAYMRFTMRYFVSIDSLGCYLPWFEDIVRLGRLKAIGTQIGDYNVLYQTIISVLSYLPLEPLYIFKAFSIVFDILCSVTVGLFVFDKNGKKNHLLGAAAFAVIWLAPVVAFNSSLWAQCDMIYTFFILLSLMMLRKNKYIPSFILLGIAFAFKLQAVLIVPFYLFYWFKEKKFSILHFLLVPLTMWITTIPGIIGGRSLLSGFDLYLYQTDEFHWAVVNYASPWLVFSNNFVPAFYDYIYPIAMTVVLGSLAGWMIYVLKQKKELSDKAYLSLALLLTYTTVLFLPSMHERYGFIYEILVQKQKIHYSLHNASNSISTYLFKIFIWR